MQGWYFAAWLLNCSFLHEQVSALSCWAISGSPRSLRAFLGALPGVLTPLLVREDKLDPLLEKSSCRIIFQCPSRHSKLSPKGFPLAGYKSTSPILVCCSHFTVLPQNCSEEIISSNKGKNLFYLSSFKLCGQPRDRGHLFVMLWLCFSSVTVQRGG